ncbi:MAG: ABC-2 type transport system ATP-binding protein [Kiritimatiellia bacterium]
MYAVAMHELVQLQAVGKRYGAIDVLADVDLTLRAGEVIGLIGPNGGGKSTLLLLMAGLIRPTHGTVHIDGVHAHETAVARKGSVGLITADAGVYPLLTGWENLIFFGGLFGVSPSQTRTHASSMVDELQLNAAMNRKTGTWSSGMKQKLSLVRARLLEPKLLLLDEPTANLDPIATDIIYRTVRREADEGLAVVLVTHDLTAAQTTCDRVAIIEGGIRHVEPISADLGSRHLLDLYDTHTVAR